MNGDDFVFDWTKTLGFRGNPFTTDIPKPVDKYFSGLIDERKKLNLFILEKYPFGTVSGEEGFGKTMMLKWIQSQLKSHKDRVRISYINASELKKERDLIEELVSPLLNVYEKNIAKVDQKLRLEEVGKFIYSKLSGGQRLLILIDNVGGLPKRYVSLFKYFFKNKIGVQVIAAGNKKEIADSGIRTIADKDWLKINLDGLRYQEMKILAEKRIRHFGQQGIFPFQESMLKKIHDKSKGNPKQFLEGCREKVTKLSLDKEYIKKELENIRGEEVPDDSGRISIKLGGKKKKKEKSAEELFDLVDVPDVKEQQEMLAEIVNDDKKEPAKKEGSEKKEEKPALEVPVMDEVKEEVEEDIKSKEKEKKKKKEADEKQETEDLLSQLAKEFEVE